MIVTIGILPARLSEGQLHRVGPPDIYPDPAMTPGAADPQITQRNIGDTICSRNWSTKLVRPPAGYTSKLKWKQLRKYGGTVHQTRAELINPNTGKIDTSRCVPHSDNVACYEEDHLIPIEDGGRPHGPEEPMAGTVQHQGRGHNHGRTPEGRSRGIHPRRDLLRNPRLEEELLHTTNDFNHPQARPGDPRGPLVCLL